MTRLSRDELAADGSIRSGYDYSLEVWVVDGLVVECGHPESMREGRACCNGWEYRGMSIRSVPGHEIRPLITEGRTIWNSDGTDGPALICSPPKWWRKED